MSAQRSGNEIPVGINVGLTAAFLAAGLSAILVLPQVLSRQPAWGLVLAPFALLTPTLWALIHEAIHRGLHPNRTWNDFLGRALCVIFGSPLRVLRFGHLTHHRVYSSAPAASDPAPERRRGSRARAHRMLAVAFYYPRIFGGVYLAEVAACFLVFLPRAWLLGLSRRALGLHPAGGLDILAHVERDLLAPNALYQMRLDGLLILGLYTAGFLLYGPYAWMLLGVLAARAALVSFMDNVYHHTPDRNSRTTVNLLLPGWASQAILYANLHAVHHRRPGTSWKSLPKAAEKSSDWVYRGFLDASIDQVLRPSV